MKNPVQIAEDVINGEMEVDELGQLTPGQLEQAVDIAFDAEESADEVTAGNVVEEDDEGDELVPA